MRLHEACCFSMMGTNVPDALEAMDQSPVDLSMSFRAPIGATPTTERVSRGLNLLVTYCLRLRSQEGFEGKSPL